ncbi:hypothetical protein CW304_04500 [Bacillus sp. UFRGS-B20]|nr:hypothetical protein CW304_04500 [Bacillus sp. UFRGS-B20]
MCSFHLWLLYYLLPTGVPSSHLWVSATTCCIVALPLVRSAATLAHWAFSPTCGSATTCSLFALHCWFVLLAALGASSICVLLPYLLTLGCPFHLLVLPTSCLHWPYSLLVISRRLHCICLACMSFHYRASILLSTLQQFKRYHDAFFSRFFAFFFLYNWLFFLRLVFSSATGCSSYDWRSCGQLIASSTTGASSTTRCLSATGASSTLVALLR